MLRVEMFPTKIFLIPHCTGLQDSVEMFSNVHVVFELRLT